MGYKIRSNGDGKFWVIDTQTNAPTTPEPMTRDEAVVERDARIAEEVVA